MPSECPKCGAKFAGRTIGTHAQKCGVPYDMLFWQKVDKSAGPDACWPWTGARTSWNYGHFNSKTHGEYMAHRLAWELANGRKPPAGVQNGTVMHTCDNPPCCNPAHLVLGTHVENMQQMTDRGRRALATRAKITPDQVIQIRKDYGRVDTKALSAKYGLKRNTIYLIASGRTWRHVK